jgi:outer membrane protein OmpA-like peptidoglycan-associated protein
LVYLYRNCIYLNNGLDVKEQFSHSIQQQNCYLQTEIVIMLQRIFLCFCLLAGTICRAQDSSTVYFEFDKYELTSEAKQTLDKILAKQNLYSALIYGHTDQLGTNSYNERLSIKRANAVKEYFLAKGVNPQKMKLIKGFGEAMPAIAQLDAASRQANRRVVIVADYEVFATDSVVIDEKPETPVTNSPVRKPVKERLIDEVTDTTTKAGDNIILKNINFYGGRHVFLPESYSPLMELLYVMQTVPTLEIEIQGHICCQEGTGDGLDIDTGEPFLSYNRAKAVWEYLVAKGIDRKRMTYKGFGHRYPIILFEENEEERTTNRRVEIKILKK